MCHFLNSKNDFHLYRQRLFVAMSCLVPVEPIRFVILLLCCSFVVHVYTDRVSMMLKNPVGVVATA